MNARSTSLSGPARASLRTGLIAAGISAVLAVAWPEAAAPAYRFAAFACLQPMLGCLMFALIYRITGGQWGEALLPFFRTPIRVLPWVWPLIAVLVFVPAASPRHLHFGPSVPPNPSVAMLLMRAVIYEVIFIALRAVALREPRSRFAAPGLLVLVFTLHFLAADWFFTLEPGWYSTAFPLVWMSVQATSGLAWAILMATLAGLDPSKEGSARRPLGADWGDLILTSVVFSTYVAFTEYLVIWSGNLPREILWFLHRDGGTWKAVIIGLALFHLSLPFACMLRHRLKTSRLGVPRVAAVLFAADILWSAWFILPSFHSRGLLLPLCCAAFLLATGGLFANHCVSALRMERSAQ